MSTIIDLAFPIVQGQIVPIDHGHMLYGACKATAAQLAEFPLGIHPLRGTPLPGGLLKLGHSARLRIRMAAEHISAALPIAGRELRIGSHLLRVGSPHIEALGPHGNLFCRSVVIAKGKGGNGNRPASEAEILAAAQTIAPQATILTKRRHTIRIHGIQVPAYEVVITGLDPATSLRLQSEGLGGRRAFGCGIFVNAGVGKPQASSVATASSDEVGHA